MGIFSRNPNARPFKLGISEVIVVFVLIMIFLQTIGVVFNLAGLKLGPVFMLLLISAVSLAAFAMAKKQIQGGEVSKKDVFAIVALTVVTILALFYLRDLVPEVFKEGMSALKIATQSVIPLP